MDTGEHHPISVTVFCGKKLVDQVNGKPLVPVDRESLPVSASPWRPRAFSHLATNTALFPLWNSAAVFQGVSIVTM